MIHQIVEILVDHACEIDLIHFGVLHPYHRIAILAVLIGDRGGQIQVKMILDLGDGVHGPGQDIVPGHRFPGGEEHHGQVPDLPVFVLDLGAKAVDLQPGLDFLGQPIRLLDLQFFFHFLPQF